MKNTSIILIACILAGASCSTTSVNTDTPIEIPFAGNVFVTSSGGDLVKDAAATIDTWQGSINDWSESTTGLSFYFRTESTGNLFLRILAANPEGTRNSTLTFTCNGKKTKVKVTSCTEELYDAGVFTVDEPGYVKVDISGRAVRPSGGQIARISSFQIGGGASEGTLNHTTADKTDECYWFRRGPSVHFNYELPDGDVEWFYNEATVPEGYAPPSTYYMLTGFKEGYMGIQTHSDGPNSVLFSVWSPFTTDNPEEIPDDMKVLTLRRGGGVTAQAFGGEGSGGQSFMDYDWKPGMTYGTLVHIRPNGDNTTDYTGYFRDEKGEWHLLASFRRPQTDTWCRKAHSFLECFEPETSIWTREVMFGNQWACLKDGTWIEVTKARFTCDNTGRQGMRADMYGNVQDGCFLLRNCGFFDEKTEYGSTFYREPAGQCPQIDFELLEGLD